MTDALHISNLSASIEGRAVLRDVSLVVGEGERHVLTGASGSGKTLLGRAVLRLLPAGGSYEAGAIRLGETDLLSLSESDMRRVRGEGVAMVPQLAMAGLHPQRRLLSLLAERLRQRRQLSAREAREEGLRLLARVGVADPEAFARKWPHQLSGGMRQRVAVALALADAPRVLIADEPTSGLDAASRHWVMAALDQERRERGMALLLITHDLDLVGPSEMTSVMEDARVRESGRFDALDLLVRGSSRAAVALGAEEGTVLQVEGLTVDHVVRKGFAHTVHRACSDVSFSVRPREIVALVGPSGAGKSSVLGAIAAQIPHAGRVRLDGAPLARTIAGAGRGVQLAAQDASGTLDPRMSLGESLAEALNGTSPSAKPVSEWLALVGLDPALLHRLPSEVSAGQRQRVVVARALCRDPRVLLLDEPTSGLDAISANALVRLLTDIRDRVGFACVVASHDMRIVNALADRVLTLEGGRLVHTQGDGPT